MAQCAPHGITGLHTFHTYSVPFHTMTNYVSDHNQIRSFIRCYFYIWVFGWSKCESCMCVWVGYVWGHLVSQDESGCLKGSWMTRWNRPCDWGDLTLYILDKKHYLIRGELFWGVVWHHCWCPNSKNKHDDRRPIFLFVVAVKYRKRQKLLRLLQSSKLQRRS